ncbi:MAG: aminotransferase class I/II-fold pyridoxal phosphate-dependent enzyme [Chloroflexota bacterium]
MKIAPFALERYFAKYEFEVPYLLCSSDCESVSIQSLLDLEPGAQDHFHAQWLGYTDSQGSPELRGEIANLYDKTNADQILVFAGAEEAIFVYMNAMLDPGDHIIVHTPCYQSLIEVATAIGCEVTAWQTIERDQWELDVDLLRRSIKLNTKAIVFNCPHNPTGYLMSHDKQRQIVEIAREHNLLIFSDEVYRFLELNAEDTLPATCDLYDQAVSLGVMSKTFGLAGLRIGWIATQNRDIQAQLATFKDYTTICNSAPSEFLSSLALRHRDVLVQRNLDIIRFNLNILDDFFARHVDLFNWSRPKAGSTAFPKLKIGRNIDEFCSDLVQRKGVMLLPGTCYGITEPHFRIGFGRANLPEAVAKFEEYLQETY